MNSEFFRRYIDILESLDQDDLYQWLGQSNDTAVIEVDRTDELDFDPSDTFEQVIEKVRSNQDNRIGYGKYREGWHHPFNKQLVIKVASPRDDNTLEECAQRNLWEFMVWHAAKQKGGDEVELLMPCEDIDPDGMWLTQRKGSRVPADKEIPVKGAAAWIGDRKKENFAMLAGEYKSIDYGSKKALEHFNLPEDYDQARQAVAEILARTQAPVNDPDYGKSEPKPADPED
jgi:hypothetical protein